MVNVNLSRRPRRLRRTPFIRDLFAEESLSLSHLIQPYFLSLQKSGAEPIPGFTDVFRWGEETLQSKIAADRERGVRSFLIFGVGGQKDLEGSEAYDPNGLVPRVLANLRSRFGTSIVLFSDICLCPYTSHGHCGVLKDNHIDNDATLPLLQKMALTHAEAGVDFVAPSDMMDGRVGAIREHLDQNGFSEVGILAYTAKYASSYYGPFREALDCAPQFTDRASYQMDGRSSREALRELELDSKEGADAVMVKPALPYLDIISAFSKHSTLPVAAYSVSAEYEMVKRLAHAGLTDERKMVLENLVAIRRAGANLIITYYASEIAEKGWIP